MRLWLATTNRGKAAECTAILAPLGWEVVVPERLEPVEEDGTTFRANALKKARAAAARLGGLVLAEDSGLVVPALDGEPGLLSARYAGEGATDAANNRLLVERIVARGLVAPEAEFVCHAVVVDAAGRVVAEAEGRVAGRIEHPARGAGGFGYDPLFQHPPSGRRMAELAPAEKARVGHRGQALRALAARLLAGAPDGGPPPAGR